MSYDVTIVGGGDEGLGFLAHLVVPLAPWPMMTVGFGFRVEGLGFRVCNDCGFGQSVRARHTLGPQGSTAKDWVSGFGFRVSGFGFSV